MGCRPVGRDIDGNRVGGEEAGEGGDEGGEEGEGGGGGGGEGGVGDVDVAWEMWAGRGGGGVVPVRCEGRLEGKGAGEDAGGVEVGG